MKACQPRKIPGTIYLMNKIPLRAFLKAQQPCFYKTLTSLAENHGPHYSLNLFGQKIVVISDNAAIRDLLLKNGNKLIKGRTLSEVTAMTKGLRTITESDGENWSSLRSSFQPGFSKDVVTKALEKIPPVMDRAVRSLTQDLTNDLQDRMEKIALAMTLEMFFSYKSPCLDRLSEPEPYLENQHYLVDQLLVRMQRSPLWKYLPTPSNFRVKKTLPLNRNFLVGLVEQRRREKNPPGDFLDLLLSMRAPDGRPLSDDQLAVHMYGLVGAAFESTGAVLHWALCHLAERPDLREKLCQEKSSEEKSGEENSLSQRVIFETTRLYPPFPMLIRECREEITSDGILIPKGSFVFHLIGSSQRDPAVWGPDADEFKPERFLNLTPEQKASFYPFGIGKRVCLGEGLARQELPQILSILSRNFKFRLTSSFPEPRLRFALGPASPTRFEFQVPIL
jgi:cytochrome P450